MTVPPLSEGVMDVFDVSTTPTRIVTAHGETIYEVVGRTVGSKSTNHSVAHVVIAPDKSSLLHFHPQAEESYYILAGEAKIEIGDDVATLRPGQTVLIPPPLPHKIYNTGHGNLVLLVVCVPAWEPSNTVWLEKAHDPR
jgi:mannose-6-phosphate isomerase-like protein (cupin superfamily)